MNKEQSMVTEFHKAFDIPVETKPSTLGSAARERRLHLMTEELLELYDAMRADDLAAIADGIADLLYVVYGTAVEAGIDIEPIFAEVHRSNMTKIGGHKNEIGKWVKPDSYSPALLEPIIKDQLNG